jgi:N utilization substance protein B
MKSAARLYAVQALFQMEALGASADRVAREFETHRFGEEIDGAEYAEGHVELFRRITSDAVTHQARIDQLTHRALAQDWRIDRIDPTMRALFRAAGAELVASDTPPRVVIAEYLDVADAFYPDLATPAGASEDERRAARSRERLFVNAVLDHMAREARPDQFDPAR